MCVCVCIECRMRVKGIGKTDEKPETAAAARACLFSRSFVSPSFLLSSVTFPSWPPRTRDPQNTTHSRNRGMSCSALKLCEKNASCNLRYHLGPVRGQGGSHVPRESDFLPGLPPCAFFGHCSFFSSFTTNIAQTVHSSPLLPPPAPYGLRSLGKTVEPPAEEQLKDGSRGDAMFKGFFGVSMLGIGTRFNSLEQQLK